VASQAEAIFMTQIPKHASAKNPQCLQISIPSSEVIRLWFSM